MSIPTDYDMNKILPVLQSFGVAPNQLGPDKLNELMSLSEHISDPSKITPEITHQILNILGIGVRGDQRQSYEREPRSVATIPVRVTVARNTRTVVVKTREYVSLN